MAYIRFYIFYVPVMAAIICLWSLPASAQVPKLYAKDNILVGANFNDGPGSSDMTLIMQLSGGGKVYVDEGHPVKYLHEPDNKDIKGWTKVEFDDKKWKDGFSGVGFSDGDDNTTTPAGITSIWTRYHFNVPDASSLKELTLLVDYDDAYIAWLNGVEIARTGSVTAKGLKVGDEPAWNFAAAGIANRGSCELVAGKPNKDRWKCAQVEKAVIKVEFGGPSPLPVEPAGKLAITWSKVKSEKVGK